MEEKGTEMKSVGLQQSLARSVDYEDYAATSAKYDDTRVTIGLEIIVGCLASTNGRRLDEQVVLDVGCGTGNYLEALGDLIGFGYGIDINEGMVVEAKKNYETSPTYSSIVETYPGFLMTRIFSMGSSVPKFCTIWIMRIRQECSLMSETCSPSPVGCFIPGESSF